MKKILALTLALVFVLALVSCGEKPDVKGEGVMTYDEYVAAELDSKVVIEAYVQAIQKYSEQYGNTSLYLQDKDGGYFVYRYACTADEFAKFTVGTKVKVSGTKSEWSGEVEITDATVEVEEGKYIAKAKDVTSILDSDSLIDSQNQFVSFKGMTVAASTSTEGTDVPFTYKGDSEGDDIYFRVSLNGKTYDFTVESDLCDSSSEVYKAVQKLKIGDKIDLEGFLYWYKGANPHITSVKVVK